MRWVGRQAQLVNPLPGANTHIRRIELGTLLGQFPASLFGALVFFVCEPLSGSLDEVDWMGRHRFRSMRFGRGAPPPAVLRHRSRTGTGYTTSWRVGPIFGLEVVSGFPRDGPAPAPRACYAARARSSSARERHGEAELSSGTKAKGAGEKISSAGEAAAQEYSRPSSWRRLPS